MISARLVHLIESHGEQIIDRALAQIHRDSETIHSGSLLDHELRQLGRDLLSNLGHWLSGGNENDLALRYQQLGKLCFDQEIPLHEAVRQLAALRRKMLDFAQEQLISNSSVELYAEEELDRRVGRFFDLLNVELVRGFEKAIPRNRLTRSVTH
jgi:hypothetical protein